MQCEAENTHPVGGAACVNTTVSGQRSKAKQTVVVAAVGDVCKDTPP